MALGDRQNGSTPRDRNARPLDPVAADIVAARGGCEAAMNRLFKAARKLSSRAVTQLKSELSTETNSQSE